MTSWLRDLTVEKVHPGKILNQDLAATARQASQKISLPSLLEKIEVIQATGNAIKAGTNLRLAMEAMLLKLARV